MSQKPTLVILFRWHFHLPNPLKLSELQDLEILKRAPQSIHEINHEKYQKIKKEGNIDERFTIY